MEGESADDLLMIIQVGQRANDLLGGDVVAEESSDGGSSPRGERPRHSLRSCRLCVPTLRGRRAKGTGQRMRVSGVRIQDSGWAAPSVAQTGVRAGYGSGRSRVLSSTPGGAAQGFPRAMGGTWW